MKDKKTVVVALAEIICLAAISVFAGTKVMAEDSVAATIRLSKTEGSVTVSDSSGSELKTTDNMRLFNGNEVATQKESYAYINLDDTKALKLDSVSEVEVRKKGDNLEVLLVSGNLFSNVSEKLSPGQNMNIRSSNMVMGIRGTTVIVNQIDESTTEVIALEGNASGKTSDGKPLEIAPGEKATVENNKVTKDKATLDDINGSAQQMIANNPKLQNLIQEESNIEGIGDITPQSAEERRKQDESVKNQKLAKVDNNREEQNKNSTNNIVWEKNNVVVNNNQNTQRQQGQTQNNANNPPAENNNQQTPANEQTTPQNEEPKEAENDNQNKNSEIKKKEEKKYEINLVYNEEGGALKCSKSESVEGKEIIITAKAKDGYTLKSILSKQVDFYEAGKNKYGFKMPKKNVTIKGVFEKTAEEVPEVVKRNLTTVYDSSQGTVTASYDGDLVAGTKVKLQITPNAGYSIASVEIYDVTNSKVIETESIDGSSGFTMPDGDVEVRVTFSPNAYNISKSVTGEAAEDYVKILVNGEEANQATYGQTVTLKTHMAYEAYPKIININGDSTGASYKSIEEADSENWTLTYEFTMPAGDVAVQVEYVKPVLLSGIDGCEDFQIWDVGSIKGDVNITRESEDSATVAATGTNPSEHTLSGATLIIYPDATLTVNSGSGIIIQSNACLINYGTIILRSESGETGYITCASGAEGNFVNRGEVFTE